MPSWSLKRATVAAVVVVFSVLALALWAVFGGVGGVGGCTLRSVNETEFVARNEAVLRSVPVYGGSKLLQTYSIGQLARNSCFVRDTGPPYGSFMTTHLYALPSAT